MEGQIKTCDCAKLCIFSFALACAIVWSVVIFATGVLAAQWGYGADFVKVFSNIYFGYGPTYLGSVIGLFWAFLDAFIAGLALAWLYNKFRQYCFKCCCACDTE